MYTGLFTFYGPSRYPSSFSSWRPKSKKFPFYTNFHFPLVKNFVACYRFNFDAFDLPHRKFKPLYHKSWSACCLPQKGKTKNSVRGYIGEDKCFAIDFNGTYINNSTRIFILFFKREDCSRTKVDLNFHQLRRHLSTFRSWILKQMWNARKKSD